MFGVALAVAGYFLFSLQDALVKWLVADNSVWQILLVRSLTILLLCVAIGRGPLLRQAVATPRKTALMLRGAVILAAWLCYYSAARYLQLAELTTIYFAAPMIVTVLSVMILGERVAWSRWGGTAIGFVGVVIACDPGGVGITGPVALVLISAALWAYSNILVRRISMVETTLMQMLYSGLTFAAACLAALPWTWQAPTALDIGLMVALGVVSAAAQYLLLEGIRRAPASLIAPFEYSSLLWAFLLSYAIWLDVPRLPVFVGAAIILCSGLLVIAGETRMHRSGG